MWKVRGRKKKEIMSTMERERRTRTRQSFRNSVIPVVSCESNLGSSKGLSLPLGQWWHLEILLSSAFCFALILEVTPFLAWWTSRTGGCKPILGFRPCASAYLDFCNLSSNTAVPMQMITSSIRKDWTCEGGNLFSYAAELSKNCKQKSRMSWGTWENQVEGLI